MLGLGGGLTSVSAPSSRVLLETYTADWSSDVDGWSNWTSNDNPATLTRVASFEGKSDVLRTEFNTDPEETGASGIKLNPVFSTDMQVGDRVVISTFIYLDSAWDSTGDGSDDLTNLFEGTDGVSFGIQAPGQTQDYWSVPQDEWYLMNMEVNGDDDDAVRVATNTSLFLMFSSTIDSPQYRARFYLHGLQAKLYRSQLFT